MNNFEIGFQDLDEMEAYMIEGGSYTNTSGVTYESKEAAQWHNSIPGKLTDAALKWAEENIGSITVYGGYGSNGPFVGVKITY